MENNIQNTETEVWRPIQGYENLYAVSNLGRVKSFDRVVNGKCGSVKLMKGRVLKPGTQNNVYLFVSLYKNNKAAFFLIHRLVAIVFQETCGQFKNGLQIDHLNTVRTDNRAVNLRWVTRKENQNNPLTKKKMSDAKKGEKCYLYGKFGKDNPNSIPIIQYSLTGEKIAEFEALIDVERKLGISNSSISACCKGKLKTAGGYVWRYKTA